LGLVYAIANKSKIIISIGGKQTYDVFLFVLVFCKLFENFFGFPMRTYGTKGAFLGRLIILVSAKNS